MSTRYQNWIKILKISWPLIVANSFWNFQLFIDRVFLGAYSTEALAAAGLVSAVFWTPMALLQQTSNYVTTFVAQYFGAKTNNQIGSCVWQALYVSFIGGLLFLLLIFISPYFFHSLGHDPTVTELEVKYFNALCFSALPLALVACFSGFFSGIGLTKMIILLNAVGLVFNAFFDYLFIFGNFGAPAMGVVGAGYATAFSSLISALLAAFIVFQKKYDEEYHFFKNWRWKTSLIKRFLKFGIPSGAQWALEGLAFTVFQIIIGTTVNGAEALAATSIAITIMMLSTLPSIGIAQGTMILVGQSLGKKDPNQAESYTWSGVQVSLIYILLISSTFVLFPSFYIDWFKNPTNPLWNDVAQLSAIFLFFVAGFTVSDSMYFNFSFALKGAGDTKFVSLVALIMPWPLMILPTYIFKDLPNGPIYGWAAALVYAILVNLVIWIRFHGGKWKSMSVIEESPQSTI